MRAVFDHLHFKLAQIGSLRTPVMAPMPLNRGYQFNPYQRAVDAPVATFREGFKCASH